MRINVIGKQFEITDPIREHAEHKSEKLDTYMDMIQQIDFLIWKENDNIEDFSVEIAVDVEHHDDFIAKTHGADLYGVIDEAIHKVDRQLRDHREKLKVKR